MIVFVVRKIGKRKCKKMLNKKMKKITLYNEKNEWSNFSGDFKEAEKFYLYEGIHIFLS